MPAALFLSKSGQFLTEFVLSLHRVDWDDFGHVREPSNKLCREEGLRGLGEEN